jgi:hypothetical protein
MGCGKKKKGMLVDARIIGMTMEGRENKTKKE